MPVKLSDPIVRKLKPREKPFYLADRLRKGLQIRVAVDGSKSWSYRYRVGRRMRRVTLGDFDTLSLAAARAAAKDAAKLVAKDVDPQEQKQQRRTAPTVNDVVELYVKWAEAHKRSWKEDERRLHKFVLKKWKHRPLAEITRLDVKQLLATLASTPYEANRLHSVISKLFSYAVEEGLIVGHPLVRMKKAHDEPSRDRVLSHQELRQFWVACDALDVPMAAFFKLRLVTLQRGREVGTMRWADIDRETGVWTIPATIAKNKLQHRVPLTSMALEILQSVEAHENARLDAHPHAKRSEFVLLGARGKRQQAEAAATFNLPDFRGHDLRRTGASLMAGSGIPRLTIGKVLNHVETGVTSIYDRHSYDAEKRAALGSWARTLDGILKNEPATVLPFSARG